MFSQEDLAALEKEAKHTLSQIQENVQFFMDEDVPSLKREAKNTVSKLQKHIIVFSREDVQALNRAAQKNLIHLGKSALELRFLPKKCADGLKRTFATVSAFGNNVVQKVQNGCAMVEHKAHSEYEKAEETAMVARQNLSAKYVNVANQATSISIHLNDCAEKALSRIVARYTELHAVLYTKMLHFRTFRQPILSDFFSRFLTERHLRYASVMLVMLLVFSSVSLTPAEGKMIVAEDVVATGSPTLLATGYNSTETAVLVEKPVEEIAVSAPAKAVLEGEVMEVPAPGAANTGVKTFMDYRTITAKRSLQYQMQQSATTDERGFRKYDGCYMVALGTYYSETCGHQFLITLSDGTTFKAVTGDIKSNLDTDAKHQHKEGNIVEFIVDRKQIPKECSLSGDMSSAGFEGTIAAIRRLS